MFRERSIAGAAVAAARATSHRTLGDMPSASLKQYWADVHNTTLGAAYRGKRMAPEWSPCSERLYCPAVRQHYGVTQDLTGGLDFSPVNWNPLTSCMRQIEDFQRAA